jgi:hypothetical protein
MILIGIIYEVTSTTTLPWYLLHGTINKESCFKLLHRDSSYDIDLRAINFFDSMSASRIESIETY